MKVQIDNVLISDAVDPLCVQILENHGIKVVCKTKLSKDELIQELKGKDGLIVRSDTKVTKEIIEASSGLKVIGRAGTGVDNIDLDAATKKGIIVINAPGGNSISACELTCALITNLARNVAPACQSLKEGRWDRKAYTGNEIYGKTLAILGLGRIGREVAIRMQSYGMKTVGFDPIVSAEDARSFGVEKMELDQIWPIADYITVHTPLIPATRNLINSKTLLQSKKGVCLVNVARGGIIDEEALLEGLKNGTVGGAALDVYQEEPPKNPTTLAVIQHPRVVATPHLGASTNEAQVRVAVEIAEQFTALSERSKPGENFIVNGAVNAPALSAGLVKSNGPWISLTQLLGNTFRSLVKEIPSGAKVQLTTFGKGLEKMTFLSAPLIAGLLSKDHEGLNLISAPAAGKNAGITIQQDHQDGDRSVQITIGPHSIKGTLNADNDSKLLSLGDAIFLPDGIPVSELAVVVTAEPAKLTLVDVSKTAQDLGIELRTLSRAAGKKQSVVVLEPASVLPKEKVSELLKQLKAS